MVSQVLHPLLMNTEGQSLLHPEASPQLCSKEFVIKVSSGASWSHLVPPAAVP